MLFEVADLDQRLRAVDAKIRGHGAPASNLSACQHAIACPGRCCTSGG
jgi:hypothetical protein